MNKTVLLLLCAVLASAAMSAPKAADDADMVSVMRAMFLSQAGGRLRAAAALAEVAEELQDPQLMGEAHREALRARNSDAALEYARRWREMGGGAPALRAGARLLLALGRGSEAAPILDEMKARGAQNEELFRLLIGGNKADGLALGRALLGDSAEGDVFKARLAAHFGEWETAENDAARGLARAKSDAHLTELHFVRMRAAEGREDAAAAVPLLDDYLANECPGANVVCREAEAVYAFALFSEERDEWKTAPHEDAGEAALAAGQFFERAKMPARARPHYERARRRFFHAALGLARLDFRAGRLEEALAVLDGAAVADDREFAMRETTAAEILRELRGDAAAMTRVIRAREVSPDNRELLYEHSLLAESSGDIAGAIELLERMTELFPDSADGWNALGYVLADHNMRLDEAERFIKKALSINPDSANILDSLGWVYYRQGRLAEARRHLLQAAAASESAAISAHLGEVHWRLGEHALAREAFAEGKRRDAEDKVLNETLRRLRIAD